MTLTALPLGKVLHEPGSPLRHAYFPVEGIVSLLRTTADGRASEIALVGNDGCVSSMSGLGGSVTSSRAVVQSAGQAWRIDSAILMDEFQRGGRLQALLLQYVQALIAQISQTAVCNLHHTVEQQLCRWLLLSLDRIGANEIQITHELIGTTIGVRRAGVTDAATRLRAAGLIESSRGHIAVVDRAKLEAHACECYGVIRQEVERLAPRAAP